MSWTIVLILAGLALVGEILESLSSAAGIRRGRIRTWRFFRRYRIARWCNCRYGNWKSRFR